MSRRHQQPPFPNGRIGPSNIPIIGEGPVDTITITIDNRDIQNPKLTLAFSRDNMPYPYINNCLALAIQTMCAQEQTQLKALLEAQQKGSGPPVNPVVNPLLSEGDSHGT